MNDLKPLLIDPTLSIQKAFERMDAGGARILFVVGSGDHLRGCVSDGDLRRWILKGGSLAEPIQRAMHANPVVLRQGHSSLEAREMMLRQRVDCLPVVDPEGRILSAVWWMDLFDQRKPVKKGENVPVVIMAGGEGNRLGPLTKILPKPLVPIGDKPVIELIMDRFIEYGSRDFTVTLNYKSRIVRAYFEDNLPDRTRSIRFVEEKIPLGTAGSLGLLGKSLKKTFWLSNCDILIDADLSDITRVHRENGNDITLVCSVKHYTIPYGVCHLDVEGKLKAIDEKPAYDLLVNTGLYLVEPQAVRHVPENKVFHFTDLIDRALKEGDKVGVYPVSEKAWMDMGQIEELKEMSRRFGAPL